MISSEREKELLQITDAKTLFQELCRELNIPEGESLPLNLTTPAIAEHIMTIGKSCRNDSEIIEDIGLKKSLLKK